MRDKAIVTDSDRVVIPAVRREQGAASPRVTLADRVESCTRGALILRRDRNTEAQAVNLTALKI